MINRPFSTTNINIFDEKTRNATPANFYGQNVFLPQDQHRKIYDTLTTTIGGIPSWSPPFLNQNPANYVTFTFNRNPEINYQPQNLWQYQTPQMQNLSQMHQRNAVDLMELQRRLNTPCQLRFHLDNQTSTSDLGAKHNLTELKNLAAILKSKWPSWLDTPKYRNHRKLILRNVTAKVEGNVYDHLDENEKSKKKVNFDFENTRDQECQVQTCCQSCESDKKPTTSREKRTRKKRKKSPPSESTTDDDDDKR